MTVSHELRTPLTAIYGWARMLSTGQIRDGAAPARAWKRSSATPRRCSSWSTICSTSRASCPGKLRLDVQPVATARGGRRGDRRDSPGGARQEHQHRHDPGGGGSVDLGDAGRLQQVVWNLLSNAVRFTPAGGRIEIAVARAGAGLEISVRDTGPGIAAAFLPHAFERFRQGVSGTTRAHGGLGLGLAIVRHLVELHGGTVEAVEQHAGARRDLPHRVARDAAPPMASAGARPAVARIGRPPRGGPPRRPPRPGRRRRHERAGTARGDSRERGRGGAGRRIGRRCADDPADVDAGCHALRHRDAGPGRLRADRQGAPHGDRPRHRSSQSR